VRVDEGRHLAELRRDQLDNGVGGALDRLAELAARVCAAPVGIVSVVDGGEARPVAWWGLPAAAARLALDAATVMVNGLATEPRAFAVGHEAGARFFVAAPLRTEAGQLVGCVGVLDRCGRGLDDGQRRGLELVRDEAMALLGACDELAELRRSERCARKRSRRWWRRGRTSTIASRGRRRRRDGGRRRCWRRRWSWWARRCSSSTLPAEWPRPTRRS
jgi:hypothetical protein